VKRDAQLLDEQAAWREYELHKAAWQVSHRDATHQEHEQAMRRIADECGV
jgi:hypothetical protein